MVEIQSKSIKVQGKYHLGMDKDLFSIYGLLGLGQIVGLEFRVDAQIERQN